MGCGHRRAGGKRWTVWHFGNVLRRAREVRASRLGVPTAIALQLQASVPGDGHVTPPDRFGQKDILAELGKSLQETGSEP